MYYIRCRMALGLGFGFPRFVLVVASQERRDDIQVPENLDASNVSEWAVKGHQLL